MRLASFSVVNYRSITTAHKIQMNNMTVLVGKNNEGKSNILRALTLAMNIMQLYANKPRMLSVTSRYIKTLYTWERDYPLLLQERNPNGYSSVDLSFELVEHELQSIRDLTGIRLNSNLPIRVQINGTEAKIDIPKRGTAAFANTQNKLKIIDFVCKKIDFNFIPAIRTENDSLRVIESLIDDELSTIETSPEYIAATETIDRLQQSVLNHIAAQVVEPLKDFLPTVKDLQIHIQKDQRRAALRRNIEVVVDDGTPTPIQLKGDGIKSLTAIAMLNIPGHNDCVSVIAIEEPESHLHPESARQLFQTISTLSASHQVILTTHSPIFVNREDLKENIIVNQGKATPVKKIKEIRDVLGTHVSDNLVNAENILLVEGEDDKLALDKLLPSLSNQIKRAIQNGTLVIDYLGGAGNLSQKLSFYRNIQCKYHVLLDNDDAGRLANQEATTHGLLDVRSTTLTICNGSPNAELEDCYEKSSYEQVIQETFGVSLNVPEFRNNNKWSDRVANCFRAQGKPWNDKMEKRVKLAVANAISADPTHALNQHKCTSINALVIALESMTR